MSMFFSTAQGTCVHIARRMWLNVAQSTIECVLCDRITVCLQCVKSAKKFKGRHSV